MNPDKWMELFSVACGLAYLLLIIRQNIWCWIFGIIASAITVYLYITSKLYLEAGLNVYYIAAGFYGWFFWTRNRKTEKKVPVINWPLTPHLVTIAIGGALTAVLGYVMHHHTDSPRPYVDAGITIFSFAATYMEARKVLTGWYYWFVLNATSIWVSHDRGLLFYAALSVFYTAMCIPGYRQWRKSYRQEQAHPPQPAHHHQA